MFHFFLTGRTVFRTSLFSYVIGPPVSKTFHFFVTARALARTIPFSSQLNASCFEQVSFGRNSMHPAGTLGELRNSGESVARSDDPSSPFSPRRPLNGGLVSQKRETSHFWDSMHKSSQTADFRVSERFHTRNGAHFRDALHNPRQKQAIENERKPNTSGLATPVPYRRTCGNTPNTRQRARF